MNMRLYGIRGISTERTDYVRRWIDEEGGTISKEYVMPLLTGDAIQFQVAVDGESWLLTPQGGTYSWLKVL